MEIAASHHTDPDNDQARYRYKEIPGILLAFIIHLSSTNKPRSTALISSPEKSSYNGLCSVVESSHEEWEEGGGIVGVLIMLDNAEQHN